MKKTSLPLSFVLSSVFLAGCALNTQNFSTPEQIVKREANMSSAIFADDGITTIKIPNLPVTPNKTLRAFIDDKKIYIIDTKDKIFVNNNYYLLKSSNAFFPMIVSMDLDGQYILKNDDDITTKVTLNEFNKIEIVGKVNFKLTRETFI